MKDRIAKHILNEAEASGKLKAGMHVIAASSGNTGASVAMMCAVKGYKCTIITNAKTSQEKVDALHAFGANVIVGPSGVPADSPDHYQNIELRMVAEDPRHCIAMTRKAAELLRSTDAEASARYWVVVDEAKAKAKRRRRKGADEL